MQNAGQFGQGGAPSHQGATYGHTESSQTTTGSITSSLRQFRKKDVDKQQVSENGTTVAESHVARVAPHNHYPPRPQDCYRYPSQFPDYGLPSQVKYSEISDHQPLQEQVPPSVIHKVKGKEYMEMCNVPQPHMKQAYSDHINNQQPYGTDPNLHPHAQYLQKDPQVHPTYKPESQYYPPKEAQYQQLAPQMQKYNMTPQMKKYPTENDFLSKLRRIHPTMARSIMSEHHFQEAQSSYQPMDQNRMYQHQNQRYMNYTAPMQNNPYPHGYMPPQPYGNYPPSCSYTRAPQMPPRFPSTNPHERSISPRRTYTDNLPIPPINYTALPQRISPSYPQYSTPEYAQHYQHRRGPQEFYPQPCRTAQYLPHQMPQPELTENRVTVSDSIKQYIENWADEETASEMNQMESNRMCKENLRSRDEQSTETVYMINASELQYLENGIPIVASENGIPLVTSENGQYFLKSGVTIDNSTGMVRIVEKPAQIESTESTADRVVNLHIMDPLKPDCMLANKPSETNEKPAENACNTSEKARVVIHQNTVIQSGQTNVPKQAEPSGETQPYQAKVGTSLPMLVENGTANINSLEEFTENVFQEPKKETVDKNCSPINMEQIENSDDLNESASVICPLKLLENSLEPENEDDDLNDIKLKNMPIIDLLPEVDKIEEEKPTAIQESHTENEVIENEKECEVNNEADTNTNVIEKENTNCNNVNTNEDADIRNIPTFTEIAGNKAKATDEESETTVDESDVFEEPKEETKETAEPTKEIISKQQTAETVEEVFECDVPVNKNKTTSDISDTIAIKDNEDNMTPLADCKVTEATQSVTIPEESVTKEINDETETNIPATSSKCSEEKPVRSFSDIFSGQTVAKSTTRRAKRIFSVDDIINNIGNNTHKSKSDSQMIERRRSLQITREFLEREIDASHVFPSKPTVQNEPLTDISEGKTEEHEIDGVETAGEEQVKRVEEINSEENKQVEQTAEEEMDSAFDESFTDITEEDKSNAKKIEETEEVKVTPEIDQPVSEPKEIEASFNQEPVEKISVENNVESPDENYDKKEEESADSAKGKDVDVETEKVICEDTKLSICDDSIVNNVTEEQEIAIDRDSRDNTNSIDTTQEIVPDLNVKEMDGDSTVNEIQYRNAIRVDENNVLLEIAGELVEISVNIVNGKKVITVLPLSESTVVDFNDNYETLDTSQVDEGIQLNASDDEQNLETSLISNDEVSAEPDVIESTSEIIIGMDISLEEEIQLDLEKPQSLTTKAAKKAYDNDLQIPSITTSEDVADNSKASSYSPNDKVSSSKEQRPEKSKSERKKSLNSSKKTSSSKELNDKSVVKELMKVRKVKKETTQQDKDEEVEEFVPFKDLIKARKLKKMKLKQMKIDENVSADSTNKLDQDESSELESENLENHKNEETTEAKTKDKETSEEGMVESIFDGTKDDTVEETKSKDESKTKDCVFKVHESSKTEEKTKKIKDGSKNVEYAARSYRKTEVIENNIPEKAIKKVTFGSVSYNESEKNAEFLSETKSHRLEDPRLKSRPACGILVPSVSELLKETNRLANHKKKLSLAEYNNRKRKLTDNTDEKESKIRKNDSSSSTESKADVKSPKEEPLNRIKITRPKSLDDIKLFGKPKDPCLMKRKFSLEVTSSKPNYFDWEETQSPKTNFTSQEDPQKRLSEFKGLINHNRSKIVVDVSDLRPSTLEGSEDEILQNYKEQVDSKLSSLNLQIPRAAKPPFSDTETIALMRRFLKDEKLSAEEMEKIKKIISYKRLMQQLDRIKSPGLSSPLNPSYEIRKNCAEKEMKLHLKKVPEKKKKRFRNLYAESTTDSDSDFSDFKRGNVDYSVVQSNSYATGVPKLIIKRKTDMPVPVVRLERLDLNLLTNRKRKLC